MDGYYNNFKGGSYRQNHEGQIKMYWACQEIIKKTGKQFNAVTKEEFYEYFPFIAT